MTIDALHISWISAGLVFGIGQAVFAIMISNAPQDKDDLIRYYAWISPRIDRLIPLTLASLLVAIVLTWVYFVPKCTATGYVVSSSVSIIGPAMYLALLNILHVSIQARLYSD